MLQKAVGVNSYVIYYCHEFLMKTFDEMLFGYMVLKGEGSLSTFISVHTRHILHILHPKPENLKLWYKKKKKKEKKNCKSRTL